MTPCNLRLPTPREKFKNFSLCPLWLNDLGIFRGSNASFIWEGLHARGVNAPHRASLAGGRRAKVSLRRWAIARRAPAGISHRNGLSVQGRRGSRHGRGLRGVQRPIAGVDSVNDAARALVLRRSERFRLAADS